MSQSAISHGLKRLRQALGDQLFIRTPEGLEPTPYCLRIAGPVRIALASLRAPLDREAAFDPATPILILAALFAVYMILGMLYENTIHPLTIITTLPSAGLGALATLMLAGRWT